MFAFYDQTNHLIYLARAGFDQILILLFDSEKESIYLSQRVLLSQRPELLKTGNLSIKSICILPVEKLNKAKNEIAKYHNC